MLGFEKPAASRHTVEAVGIEERVVIRARGNPFVVVFLGVWICGWTAGGIAAVTEFARTGQPFLAIWLCGWALGWVFAAISLGWMLLGREIIAASPTELRIEQRIGSIGRVQRYDATLVRHLSPAAQANPWNTLQIGNPFLRFAKIGSVKFDYGSRTIYAGSGVEEAEGRTIVNRLLRRLPSTAADRLG